MKRWESSFSIVDYSFILFWSERETFSFLCNSLLKIIDLLSSTNRLLCDSSKVWVHLTIDHRKICKKSLVLSQRAMGIFQKILNQLETQVKSVRNYTAAITFSPFSQLDYVSNHPKKTLFKEATISFHGLIIGYAKAALIIKTTMWCGQLAHPGVR